MVQLWFSHRRDIKIAVLSRLCRQNLHLELLLFSKKKQKKNPTIKLIIMTRNPFPWIILSPQLWRMHFCLKVAFDFDRIPISALMNQQHVSKNASYRWHLGKKVCKLTLSLYKNNKHRKMKDINTGLFFFFNLKTKYFPWTGRIPINEYIKNWWLESSKVPCLWQKINSFSVQTLLQFQTHVWNQCIYLSL